MESMKYVTTFIYNGKEWKIVKYMKHFCAIPSEYIRNGKLTRSLNGLQMHAHATLDGCIDCIRNSENTRNLAEKNNISIELATRQYFGILG